MEHSSTNIVAMEKIRFILWANITLVTGSRQSEFIQWRIKSFNLRSLTSNVSNFPFQDSSIQSANNPLQVVQVQEATCELSRVHG